MTKAFQVTGSGAVVRNMRGDLSATQRIMLSESAYLEVLTAKRYGGALITSAYFFTIDDKGYSSTMPMQDYSKTLIAKRVRCTAKAVATQQAEGLAMALLEAQGVYNQYVSKGVIQIPVEQSLATQVANGGGDAWVAAAKSGQIMRIM